MFEESNFNLFRKTSSDFDFGFHKEKITQLSSAASLTEFLRTPGHIGSSIEEGPVMDEVSFENHFDEARWFRPNDLLPLRSEGTHENQEATRSKSAKSESDNTMEDQTEHASDAQVFVPYEF